MSTTNDGSRIGNEVRFKFRGTKVRYHGMKCSDCGSIDIKIDGKIIGSQNLSGRDSFTILFESKTLAVGDHVLSIVAKGDGNVGVDAFSFLE
jgi:hypothetical protein